MTKGKYEEDESNGIEVGIDDFCVIVDISGVEPEQGRIPVLIYIRINNKVVARIVGQ